MMINSFTIHGNYDDLLHLAKCLVQAGITAFITSSLVVQPKNAIEHSVMMQFARAAGKNVVQFTEPSGTTAQPPSRVRKMRRSW